MAVEEFFRLFIKPELKFRVAYNSPESATMMFFSFIIQPANLRVFHIASLEKTPIVGKNKQFSNGLLYFFNEKTGNSLYGLIIPLYYADTKYIEKIVNTGVELYSFLMLIITNDKEARAYIGFIPVYYEKSLYDPYPPHIYLREIDPSKLIFKDHKVCLNEECGILGIIAFEDFIEPFKRCVKGGKR